MAKDNHLIKFVHYVFLQRIAFESVRVATGNRWQNRMIGKVHTERLICRKLGAEKPKSHGLEDGSSKLSHPRISGKKCARGDRVAC